MCFFLLKKPHDFLCSSLDFGPHEVYRDDDRSSVPQWSSCPQERWVQLSLPPPFGFTFFLVLGFGFFFIFFFVCFVCFLYVFQLWRFESSVKSLALPEPHFSLRGSACRAGRFSCLKREGFTLGGSKLWSNFPWLKTPMLLIDTTLKLSEFGRVPGAGRFPRWGMRTWGSTECCRCSVPTSAAVIACYWSLEY